MWQVASAVILALYTLFVAFCVLLALLFGHDPVEHQPAGGWWMYVLVTLVEVGVGLLCIYLSVRFLRRGNILHTNPREFGTAALAKSLFAIMALAFGWLNLFVGLAFRLEDVVELFTHPWHLQRPFLWGIVALLFCWMVVGFLDRPRVTGPDAVASAGS